jgi:hypothetical protein
MAASSPSAHTTSTSYPQRERQVAPRLASALRPVLIGRNCGDGGARLGDALPGHGD